MALAGKQEKEKNSVELLFVGAPLLDITAHCGQEVLDRYGLMSDDCIKATEKHEELFRSLFNNSESQLSAGGSSHNTARIAKWTLGNRSKIAFIGCVGVDDFAKRMSDCLRSEDIEPLYISLPGELTGVCACLLNSEGERSMCARLGAAKLIKRHHLHSEDIVERLRKANCVFVEGYFFDHSPDVIFSLAAKCNENQVFSLGLSAEYICRDYSLNFLKVLPRVDVLFSNETEARAIAKALGLPGQTSLEEIACTLATKDRPSSSKPRIVVITWGANPVLLVQGTERPHVFPVPTGVRVVDSVGCGDAMAGAFLAIYMLTGDVCKALWTGIAAAKEIVQVSGCNPTAKVLYPLNEDIKTT